MQFLSKASSVSTTTKASSILLSITTKATPQFTGIVQRERQLNTMAFLNDEDSSGPNRKTPEPKSKPSLPPFDQTGNASNAAPRQPLNRKATFSRDNNNNSNNNRRNNFNNNNNRGKFNNRNNNNNNNRRNNNQANFRQQAQSLPRIHPNRLFFPGQNYDPSDLNPYSPVKKPYFLFKKKLECPLSVSGTPPITHKNVLLLSKFISESGKIMPRRLTGVSAKKQRELAKAIKRARGIYLPHTSKMPHFMRRKSPYSN
eukprot:TRINITY_DN4474_c0_g1_i5.p1 TRINITY_DN4474_c0_g1~~TRINITY_DN4474_c0_g1_i5.p1  ORF type:complete len:257 (+),score=65.55 TRINITY_DN4474_c0_g1_i5:359-1129(+)